MSFDFNALEQAFATGGCDAALASLASQLEAEHQYHELFEALKMQVRHRLGLPLVPVESNADELTESVRNELENGLIDACRRVGTLLLKQGKLREGWMYYRPVGEKQTVANLLRDIAPDEDNIEELVEILLHEGVDTARGFRLLLEQNGVCNAITTYDQILAGRSKAERQAAASALLERLHADLLASVRADILRQEGTAPREQSLAGLIADRDWLFNDGAYHVDTTHLASVVRMARVLTSAAELRLALDLTHYGQRLSPQLQYQGDEPFVEQYPANALYYSALLGEQVEEAVNYFRDKAMLIDPQYHGTEPLEVYLELLNRLERYEEALRTACERLPAHIPYSAYSPVLLELSEKTKNFSTMQSFCRERHDALGFTAALISKLR